MDLSRRSKIQATNSRFDMMGGDLILFECSYGRNDFLSSTCCLLRVCLTRREIGGLSYGVGCIAAKKFLSYLALGKYGIFGRRKEGDETRFAVKVAVTNSSQSVRRVSAFLSILH